MKSLPATVTIPGVEALILDPVLYYAELGAMQEFNCILYPSCRTPGGCRTVRCRHVIGTAYLLCPEAATPSLYRDALRHAGADTTFLTNVFTGRLARILVNRLALEVGPISDVLPDFPLPMGELAPLRAMAEQQGNSDFTPFWAGQASPLGIEMPAETLTPKLLQCSDRSPRCAHDPADVAPVWMTITAIRTKKDRSLKE